MNTPQHIRPALWVLLLAFLLTACSAPTPLPPEPQVATATPPPAIMAPPSATATVALPLPTSTQAPTATLVPVVPPTATQTIAPSTTPQPTLALSPLTEGLAAWCLPSGVLYTAKQLASAGLPELAKAGAWENGAFEVRALPATVCAFLYQFNQPAPQGLQLEVYELGQVKPWLVADLISLQDQPDTVSALLRHTYIVEPPFWSISYDFKVRDASGVELRADRVTLRRWQPNTCYNGLPPDLETMLCPLQQDLHPWDYGYGTPWPTLTPAPGE